METQFVRYHPEPAGSRWGSPLSGFGTPTAGSAWRRALPALGVVAVFMLLAVTYVLAVSYLMTASAGS